jgi:hypothetical protein
VKLIFSAKDMAKLKQIERVLLAEQNQPIGAKVNNSMSGVTAMGQFSDFIESIANYLPFGKSLVEPAMKSLASGSEGAAALSPQLARTPLSNGSAAAIAREAGVISAGD